MKRVFGQRVPGNARLFGCLSPEEEDPYSALQTATSSTTSHLNCNVVIPLHISLTNPSVAARVQAKPNTSKHHLYNRGKSAMTDASQKELNLLIATPEGPLLNNDDASKGSRGDDGGDKQCHLQEGVIDLKDRNVSINNDTAEIPEISIRSMQLGPQILASISVSLGSLVVGYASAYTSPALVSLKDQNTLGAITSQQESWIGSLMPLSALVGGIAGGPLIEIVGRRTTILATALPFIVSWLLIALAVNIPMIYVGRSIAGFCVGIASLCLPVYLGETIQPEVRGMLGLLPTTLGNIGILLCFVAGKYIDWKALAFLGACLPVPFLICMFLIPETPRWFISKSKNDRARVALQWLRGKDADITSEIEAIEKSHNDAQKFGTGSSFELFNKNNLKPISISIGLMFFQQMSGINAVVFYTVSIFKDAGSTIDGNLCTIIVGVVNFGATFAATMLIDRLGRKVLLYISGSAMTVSLATLGTFFYLKNYDYNVESFGWLPLLSFVVFVIGFSLGYGPIPWLMMGEILPAKIRGPAASLTTAFNWTCTFIVTKTFTDLIDAVGTHGTFWIFGSFCLVGIFFVVFCVPETQGRSLEDIEQRLAGPRRRRTSSIANLKPLPMGV